MRIKRTLLVLLTLFMSVCASAEDYYWPRGTQKYGSYMEVVEEARKAAIANNPGYSRVEAVRVIYPANGRQDMATYGLEFYCLSQGVERMCSTSYNNPVYRKGEGCTAPKIPDETTGTCKEPPTPPEDCIKGLTDLFSSPPSNIFVSGGRNFVNSSPPTGCKNGCQYLPTTSKTTSCYRYPGSDNQGFCNYVLMTDGSACAADSGNPGMTGPSLNDTPPTNPDEPPSDPNDPGCPPGYSWSGTTCVKTPTDPTEPGPMAVMVVMAVTPVAAMAGATTAAAMTTGVATAVPVAPMGAAAMGRAAAMEAGEATAAAAEPVAEPVAAMAATATRRNRTAPPVLPAPAANSRNPSPALGMTPSPPGNRRSSRPRKNSRTRSGPTSIR